MFLVFGCVVFRLAVVARAAIAHDTALQLARRAATCGAIGALAVALGALARLYFQTAEMRFPGDPWLPEATTLLLRTSWGWFWLAQVGLAVVLGLLLRRVAHGESLSLWRTAAILALCITITPALTSHAMSGHIVSRFIALPADILHLLGGGSWLGTMAVMFISLWSGRPASRTANMPAASDPHESPGASSTLAALLVYFSPIALLGAATVVASGVISSYAHLGGVGNLTRTTYGRLLLTKVAVVLVVVAFGYRNWKRMTPRLRDVGDRAMLRTVAGELVLGMLVLAVTAALVITPPPTSNM